MIFIVVMYRCESWTIKKAEHRRIDAFEMWLWRRLLRVPWTTKRSNQPILKKSTLNIHWEYWCWSWSSNTLPTWCEKPTHWKRPWCLERLKPKGEEGIRGWDGYISSLTQWIWVWVNLGNSKGQESLSYCSSWSHRVRHDLVTEQQQQSWFCLPFQITNS